MNSSFLFVAVSSLFADWSVDSWGSVAVLAAPCS